MENLFSYPEEKRLVLYHIFRYGCYNSKEIKELISAKNDRFTPFLKKLLPPERIENQQALAINQEEPADTNLLFNLYRCQDFAMLQYTGRPKRKKKQAEASSEETAEKVQAQGETTEETQSENEATEQAKSDSSFILYALTLLLLNKEKYILPQQILKQLKDNFNIECNIPSNIAIRYFRNIMAELEELGYLQKAVIDSDERVELLYPTHNSEDAKGKIKRPKNRTCIYEKTLNHLDKLGKKHLLTLYRAMALVQDILPFTSILYQLKTTVYEQYLCKYKDTSIIPKDYICNNASQDNILQDSTLYSIIRAYENNKEIEFKYYKYGRPKDTATYRGIPCKIKTSIRFNLTKITIRDEHNKEESFRLDWMYLSKASLKRLYHPVFNKYFSCFKRLTQDSYVLGDGPLDRDVFEFKCKSALAYKQLNEFALEDDLQEFIDLLTGIASAQKSSDSSKVNGFFPPIFTVTGEKHKNYSFLPKTSMPLLMSINEKRYLRTLLDLPVFKEFLNLSPKIGELSLTDYLKELLEFENVKPWPFADLLGYNSKTNPRTALTAFANKKNIPIIEEAFRKKCCLGFSKDGEKIVLSPYKLAFRPTSSSFLLVGFDDKDELRMFPLSVLEGLSTFPAYTKISEDYLKSNLFNKALLSRELIPKYRGEKILRTKPLTSIERDKLFAYISIYRKYVVKLKPEDTESKADTETFGIMLYGDESRGEATLDTDEKRRGELKVKKLLEKLKLEGLIQS